MIVILRSILLISCACLGLAQNATNETIIVPLVNNSLPLIPLNVTFQNATQENTVTPSNNNFTLGGYFEVTTSTLNAVPLDVTDLSVIKNDAKLVILVPCRDYFNTPPYKNLIKAYKDAGNYTVINFDWKNISTKYNYTDSPDEYQQIAGDELAMFIVALQNKGIEESNIHIIGGGHGALVASHAAKLIQQNNTGRIGRLTALNPPRKNIWACITSFFKNNDDSELKPTDAVQVDTLHTTDGHSSSGGVDFYANKGKDQPGCYDDETCYFERSVELWIESIQSKNFIAQKCTYKYFSGWKCSDEHSIVFGEQMPTGIFQGTYNFYTKSVPPYAIGY